MTDRAAMEREVAIRREMVRRKRLDAAIDRLADFARMCWPVVEGRPLVWGWYHDLICAELEALVVGDTRRLAVAIPPRCMKSYLVGVFLPLWAWLRHPEWSILCVANEQSLATRDSLRSLNVLNSELYAELKHRAEQRGFPSWKLDPRQEEKVNYLTTRGGIRQCLSVGSRVTGKGADLLVMDDLIDAREVIHGDPARVAERMEEVNTWRREALETRFNDRSQSRAVIIGQRLHDIDPPGACIAEGFRPVVLPMRYEADHPQRHPQDPRATDGDLLDPVRFPEAEVVALERALGDQAPGQLQQRPQAREGGMIRAEWFLWLDRGQFPTDDQMRHMGQGWDLAVGATDSAAYTAGFVGGVLNGKVYVTAGYHGRWEIGGQRDALRRARREHPRAPRTWIENRANARAVISDLQRELPGLIPVEPDGDKVTRGQRWAGYAEAGTIVLPCRCGAEGLHTHPSLSACPGEEWAVQALREIVAFPRGQYADRFDAFGYLVRGLLERASVGGVTLSGAA